MKLAKIAAYLGGDLVGSNIDVYDVSTPTHQRAETICIIANAKQADAAYGEASAYIVPPLFPIASDKSFIMVEDTRMAMVGLLTLLRPDKKVAPAISAKASVALDTEFGEGVSVGDHSIVQSGCRIGSGTVIYPNVYIGADVTVGENSVIHPHVTIYDGVMIGNNVIIHAGTVIGADGFGFIPGKTHTKIPQKGHVIIRDDVEIGALCTIDRATIDDTVIGMGTKLDNMVQVGHNVQIGNYCLIASQCGISGSTVLGDYVIAGGQVGFADHIAVGTYTSFAAKSGVHHDIPDKGTYGGTPVMQAKVWAQQVASLNMLPELRKRILAIERALAEKDKEKDKEKEGKE